MAQVVTCLAMNQPADVDCVVLNHMRLLGNEMAVDVDNFKEYCLLRYDSMQCGRSVPVFYRNVLPPSSGL
jgi:hypothetical protein